MASTFLVVLALGGAAVADTPVGWEDSPDVSGFQFLLVLFLVPLGLFVVIAVLSGLSATTKDEGYRSGQPWTGEGEWFGGPRNGVEAAEQADQRRLESAGEQGGAGATY